jgi:hypothetical protein
MPSYAEARSALPEFRNEILRARHLEPLYAESAATAAFAVRGAFSAYATPTTNVHATGVGIRFKEGKYITDDQVLKVFVFDKLPLETDAVKSPLRQ